MEFILFRYNLRLRQQPWIPNLNFLSSTPILLFNPSLNSILPTYSQLSSIATKIVMVMVNKSGNHCGRTFIDLRRFRFAYGEGYTLS
jgi:hypothetical protein